jgi:hypothetical protein
VLLSGQKKIPNGVPNLSLIDQGKELGYTRERERERERKRKIEKERAPGLRCPSPPWAGPVGLADDHRDISMS